MKHMMGASNKDFNWGSISSFYDIKSCITGVSIKYK